MLLHAICWVWDAHFLLALEMNHFRGRIHANWRTEMHSVEREANVYSHHRKDISCGFIMADQPDLSVQGPNQLDKRALSSKRSG